jgi:hypothetical protein
VGYYLWYAAENINGYAHEVICEVICDEGFP